MRQRNQRTILDMTIFGGWLFADLLLALMVIFLAAQPPFPKTLLQTPTPTPTPTQEPRLEFVYHRITLKNVDYNGILNNSQSSVSDVEQRINNQAVLRKRSVGLVIVYGGAPGGSGIHQAQDIARAVVNNVLKVMGQQGSLFQRASYYDPLYFLGNDPSVVIIDLYLFKQ